MRKKVIEMWYEDEQEKRGYAETGLFLTLEDGSIIRHQSTDPIEPFGKQKDG